MVRRDSFLILPLIVLSQFAGASLWFAPNAVLGDLQREWQLPAEALGGMTSASLIGFIIGTLVFAFFAIADRFSPRIVFFQCTLLGAAANALLLLLPAGFWPLVLSRLLTGFFLAGIYPVGMKIAAGWYQRNLGHALGFLTGALVLGTAFPHLLKSFGQHLPWQTVILGVSVIAACGGVVMLFLADGPYLAKPTVFDPRAFIAIYRVRLFRASAFGYFGHMWELYAFWAFVPIVLAAHAARALPELAISFWSFWIIAAGSLGCAIGGLISLRTGSARVAFAQLASSGVCCAISPLMFHAPTPVFLAFLVFWGVVVVGDSPQFSALNAQNAPRHLVGSALTIVNSIGFAITIFSVQLLNKLAIVIDASFLFLPLVIGPMLGLRAFAPLMRQAKSPSNP